MEAIRSVIDNTVDEIIAFTKSDSGWSSFVTITCPRTRSIEQLVYFNQYCKEQNKSSKLETWLFENLLMSILFSCATRFWACRFYFARDFIKNLWSNSNTWLYIIIIYKKIGCIWVFKVFKLTQKTVYNSCYFFSIFRFC